MPILYNYVLFDFRKSPCDERKRSPRAWACRCETTCQTGTESFALVKYNTRIVECIRVTAVKFIDNCHNTTCHTYLFGKNFYGFFPLSSLLVA